MIKANSSGMFWNTLKGGSERDVQIKKWGKTLAPWYLYGQSKLVRTCMLIWWLVIESTVSYQGNIMVSHLFSTEYKGVLVSCSVHPGGIQTDIDRWPTFQVIYLPWAYIYGLDHRTAPSWQKAMSKYLFHPVEWVFYSAGLRSDLGDWLFPFRLGAYSSLYACATGPALDINDQVDTF